MPHQLPMSAKQKDERNSPASNLAQDLLPDIKKAGILRKLKTMKKKYFILRIESESGPARLEYYDNEKKWRTGGLPKRSIAIKTCFNINRKVDAKQKHVIALYTKDDCFSVVTETELELDEWLTAMLQLQQDGNGLNGSKLKPKFEHVWQVLVKSKGLGSSRNINGSYRLCLTASALSLIKMSSQCDKPEVLEFPLMSIRRCGHSNCFFFMELGRSSVTGAGELWMQSEDDVIAQNMHEVILMAMKSSREHEDMGPLSRPRSASTSENSKPIATRRPVAVVSPQANSYGGMRDRCDSMPSRPRTISEGQEISNRGYYTSPSHPLDSLRPHSTYGRTMSYSPPGISNPLSPGSAACSTDSAGSSLSIDDFDGGQSDFSHGRFSHSLPTEGAVHTEPPIKEEPLDDYLSMSIGGGVRESEGYLRMAPVYSTSAPTGPSMFLNLIPPESYSSPLSPTSGCGEYMEMTSPSSPSEGYIPMSPVGSASVDLITNSTQMSDVEKSAANIPKTSDGYIQMAPGCDPSTVVTTHREGYLNMAPLSSSLPKMSYTLPSGSLDMSSVKDKSHNLSEIAVTSSSDITRFEQFPLDKVKSFLAQTEETSEDYIRPVRAYSMGSRPQPKKPHFPVQADGARIRAYSVGSQASSVRNKKSSIDHELGSLKRIDIRASTKSSSAPLLHNRPPRIRSSASRGDLGEDLMEIDYDKPRIVSSGTDFSDQNFTIEPVGRRRSGSCSSSSGISTVTEVLERKNRLSNEREKISSHPIGQNTNLPYGNLETRSDYMSMNPSASNINKPTPRANIGGGITSHRSSINTIENTTSSPKKVQDHIHPSGDYVSLDPTFKYMSLSGGSQRNPIKSLTGNVTGIGPVQKTKQTESETNPQSIHSSETVKLTESNYKLQQATANNEKKNVLSGKTIKPFTVMEHLDISKAQESNDSKPSAETVQSFQNTSTIMPKKQESDYMIMSLGPKSKESLQPSACNVTDGASLPNESPAFNKLISLDVEYTELVSTTAKHLLPLKGKKRCSQSPQARGTSVPTSPTSRSPVPSRALPSLVTVPKTPPPSPQSGSLTSLPVVSGVPLIASLAKRLSKPPDIAGTQSAPTSRPSSVCGELQLNYASLDLPPAAEEEPTPIVPQWTRQSLEAETKEMPLSYAQIDFSSSGQNSVKDAVKENQSHL